MAKLELYVLSLSLCTPLLTWMPPEQQGKTHTMEGNMNDKEQAGIIPRSINKIFKHLESNASEYSVRVSFLELYNEVKYNW